MLRGWTPVKRNLIIMKAKELIEKFYSGQCSEEEKAQIIQYFNNNYQELENYFSEEEWKHFVNEQNLAPEATEQLWQNIHKQMQRRPMMVRMFTRLSVAAILILMIVFGWMSLNRKEKQTLSLATGSKVVDTINHLKTVVSLVLPDSSLVYLFPESKLHYAPFNNNRRDVYLEGAASFAVAKNPLKPFTVYSGALSTTALGTKFTVTAFPDSNFIRVKLIEGKVVIKPSDGNYAKLKKDYYLMPGEEFEWNKQDIAIANKKEKESRKEGASGESKITTASNWYMFNNQSLAQVLDQLSLIYHVRITYSQEDIRKINFIGKIEKTDSIQTILRDIALLNNLVVSKEGNTYSIRKK